MTMNKALSTAKDMIAKVMNKALSTAKDIVTRAMKLRGPKKVQKVRRIQKQLTTAEVRHAQRARHINVQPTVKHILPRGLAYEWAYIYRAMGREETFGVLVAYVQIVALNESDGQDWNAVYDSVMNDSRLGDGDRDVFTELVLELQRRALVVDDPTTPEEVKAGFAEMLTWQVTE